MDHSSHGKSRWLRFSQCIISQAENNIKIWKSVEFFWLFYYFFFITQVSFPLFHTSEIEKKWVFQINIIKHLKENNCLIEFISMNMYKNIIPPTMLQSGFKDPPIPRAKFKSVEYMQWTSYWWFNKLDAYESYQHGLRKNKQQNYENTAFLSCAVNTVSLITL